MARYRQFNIFVKPSLKLASFSTEPGSLKEVKRPVMQLLLLAWDLTIDTLSPTNGG